MISIYYIESYKVYLLHIILLRIYAICNFCSKINQSELNFFPESDKRLSFFSEGIIFVNYTYEIFGVCNSKNSIFEIITQKINYHLRIIITSKKTTIILFIF